MSKNLNLDKETFKAQANILSRPNAMNGRYELGNFGLNFWDEEYFPEPAIKMIKRADLADKLIAEAQSQGQDIDDEIILKELGTKVNSLMGQTTFKRYYESFVIFIQRIVKFITTNPE